MLTFKVLDIIDQSKYFVNYVKIIIKNIGFKNNPLQNFFINILI